MSITLPNLKHSFNGSGSGSRFRVPDFRVFHTPSNTSPEGMSPRICDMKIIDLILSIPLHNLGKTAVTKKVHFQDR